MSAFATSEDVEFLLKRNFTSEEHAWVGELLTQSAGALRSAMGGQWVYPRKQVTFTAYPVAGRVSLPQGFVVSIDRVELGGSAVRFKRFEDTIEGLSDEPVDVTFTYGLSEAPAELKGMNIAMVSAALNLVENNLGLAVGGLSSVAIDDFKIAFADAGEQTGHLVVPRIQAESLREAYGVTGWTVSTR